MNHPNVTLSRKNLVNLVRYGATGSIELKICTQIQTQIVHSFSLVDLAGLLQGQN